MYVVTVVFTIDPAQLAAFMPLMIENARRSRDDEPGCSHFDVSVDDAKPNQVYLYELYDDRAAFDTHLASAHFKTFAAATLPMITGRQIETWQRVAP